MTAIFHEGERAVQAQAGVRRSAERVGASIHDYIPQLAQDFVARQSLVIVGYADSSGAVQVVPLSGAPGFARALDDKTIALDPQDGAGASLLQDWTTGREVGLLAIELDTRRRMRVNGLMARSADSALAIEARQVYANCPKYIQARALQPVTGEPAPAGKSVQTERLTVAQQVWIGKSDTFFIATQHPRAGADVSHRGGDPGFVHVDSAGERLIFPDYAGNNMFNTLGNLAVNPNAGLLFLNFDTGDILQIAGKATVDWDQKDTAAFAGAGRLVSFEIGSVLETRRAVPLRWRFLAASPFNPHEHAEGAPA